MVSSRNVPLLLEKSQKLMELMWILGRDEDLCHSSEKTYVNALSVLSLIGVITVNHQIPPGWRGLRGREGDRRGSNVAGGDSIIVYFM